MPGKCQVTGTILTPDGDPVSFADVRFVSSAVRPLTPISITPDYVEVTADASGDISVEVYPGYYTVFVTNEEGQRYASFTVTVPAAEFAVLADIQDVAAPVTLGPAEQALAGARQARDEARLAAEEAEEAGAVAGAAAAQPAVALATAKADEATLAALAAGAPLLAAPPISLAGVPSPYMLQTAAGTQVYSHNGTASTLLGWLGKVSFDTVADLLAYTGPGRGVGAIWEAGGFRYQEVSAGEHLTCAGGLKLKALPLVGGIPPEAFGAKGDGVADDTVALRKWLAVGGGLCCAENAVYRHTGYLQAASNTFINGRGATLKAQSPWVLEAEQDADWKERSNLLLWGVSNFCAQDLHLFNDVDARGLKTIAIGRISITVYGSNNCHFLRCSAKVSDNAYTNSYSPIDLFGGNIDGFSFTHGETYDNVRQGIWIRSVGGSSTRTRNIRFTGNKVVTKNGQDEAIAVYGVHGGTENVWIERNTFIDIAEGEHCSPFCSSFGATDPTNHPNAYVRNIWWKDNVFHCDGGASGAFFSAGWSTNQPSACTEVHFVGNILLLRNMDPAANILRHDSGMRNRCDGNTVIMLDDAPCESAITGSWDSLDGNTLNVYCNFVVYSGHCVMSGGSVKQRKPSGYVTRHTMYGSLNGVKIETPNLAYNLNSDLVTTIQGCKISIEGGNIVFVNLNGHTGGVRLIGNSIETADVSEYLFQMANAADGASEVIDNRFSGTPPANYCRYTIEPFKRVQGNDWYGRRDDFSDVLPHVSASWTMMFPRGTFVRHSTAAVSGGEVTVGWIKTSAAEGSTAWTQVKMAV